MEIIDNYDKYQKSYILDKRDFKILNAICDNARMSYSKIGKLTYISKDRVRERIKRLENEKFILSYIPLINYRVLGYSIYYIYLKINNLPEYFKDFVKHLIGKEEVISLTKIIGKYDLEIKLIIKRKEDLNKFIRSLKKDKSKIIKEIGILHSKSLDFFSMRMQSSYFKNKIANLRNYLQPIEIDNKDKKILNMLSKNARESFVEISKKINVKFDVVRYKIKNLIKNGVILGFFSRTNKHRLGLNSYILLLNLKKELDEKDISKLKNMLNIYYLERITGRWNFIIHFYARGNKGLVETLDTIRRTFNDSLLNLDLLILLERFKPIPF
ncbi:MAG: winged helix-turn-helix transcriptional regulator [Nanoarchaeota archaeon]